MQTTEIQYGVSVLFPMALTVCTWIACRRPTRLGWLALALFLGTLSVFPAIRIGNFAEPWVKDWAGHFYLDELVRQFLTTAIPEEWIKGVVAVFVWLLMRKPANPLSWVSCAAAAHCGFAIVVGLLGTFCKEGVLKVIVGRSLGATHEWHCTHELFAQVL
jgi:RsiW-degrading membrane proteinase PrsW (M82 family)